MVVVRQPGDAGAMSQNRSTTHCADVIDVDLVIAIAAKPS
jgi:hypothetical protein